MKHRLAKVLLVTSTYVFPIVAFPLLVWAWWRIAEGEWRIGNYYIHHGFIYASKMAFVLLLAFHEPAAIDTWYDAVAVVTVVGAATAFGGWWHDVWAIRTGKIVQVSGSSDPTVAENRLAVFAPGSYLAIGATYAAVTIVGWRAIQAELHGFVWILPAALIALCVIPSVVFLALDPGIRLAATSGERRPPRA